ncbi:MAG TPA: hypothetical protein VN158_10050 [Caulobacter sp.]|nr:hypothetical protein [Caulobacter sp.]
MDFKAAPWRRLHGCYEASPYAVSPAPEYANSEVLLSALYRALGLAGAVEREVGQNGRDLEKRIQAQAQALRPKEVAGAALGANDFHALVHQVLDSPKRPGQGRKAYLQLVPVVPEGAVFAGAARQRGNSWPAGDLIRRLVWLGQHDPEASEASWSRLFDALDVGDGDDVFARFLAAELGAWAPGRPKDRRPLARDDLPRQWSAEELAGAAFPAGQFVKDIEAVAAAKSLMTRRQWTSLLEAILRIGCVAHLQWICLVNARIRKALDEAIEGGGPDGVEEARAAIYPRQVAFLSYGAPAIGRIEDVTSGYLQARLRINALLLALEDGGAPYTGGMSDAAGIAELCEHVRRHRAAIEHAGYHQVIDELEDRERNVTGCKAGVGRNMMEFFRHALYKRLPANQMDRGFDQSYFLDKRTDKSPWFCALGPVAVLALVYCCLHGLKGPRSVQRLAEHLAAFGIDVNHKSIAQNDLGRQLRMLGLVLDSPDAESGMLLVPPFAVQES